MQQQPGQQPGSNQRQYQEYQQQQQVQQQTQQGFVPTASTPTGTENTGQNSRPGSVNNIGNPPTPNQNFGQQSQNQQQATQQQQQQQQQNFTAINNFSPNSQASFSNANSGNAQPGYPQVNTGNPQLVSHNSSGYPGQEQYSGQEQHQQQWQHGDQVIWDHHQQQQVKMEHGGYDPQDQQNSYMQEVNNSPSNMDSIHSETKTFSQADKVNLNTRLKTMILNKQQENAKMDDSKTAEQNATGHFLWYSHHHHLKKKPSSVDGGTLQKLPDFDKHTNWQNKTLQYKTENYNRGHQLQSKPQDMKKYPRFAQANFATASKKMACHDLSQNSRKTTEYFPKSLYQSSKNGDTRPFVEGTKAICQNSEQVNPIISGRCNIREIPLDPEAPVLSQRMASEVPKGDFSKTLQSPYSHKYDLDAPANAVQPVAQNIVLHNNWKKSNVLTSDQKLCDTEQEFGNFGYHLQPHRDVEFRRLSKIKNYHPHNQQRFHQSDEVDSFRRDHDYFEQQGNQPSVIKLHQGLHNNFVQGSQFIPQVPVPRNYAEQSLRILQPGQQTYQNSMIQQEQRFSHVDGYQNVNVPEECPQNYCSGFGVEKEKTSEEMNVKPKSKINSTPTEPIRGPSKISSIETPENIDNTNPCLNQSSTSEFGNFSRVVACENVSADNLDSTVGNSQVSNRFSPIPRNFSTISSNYSQPRTPDSKDFIGESCFDSNKVPTSNLPQNRYQNQFVTPQKLPETEIKSMSSISSPMKKVPLKYQDHQFSPIQSEKLGKQLGVEIPSCRCFAPDSAPPEPGSYYTHLGCANSLKSLRHDLECRTGVVGRAIRIEKIRYTGREGKTAQGCPIAKWVSLIRISINMFHVITIFTDKMY